MSHEGICREEHSRQREQNIKGLYAGIFMEWSRNNKEASVTGAQ